MSKGVMRRLAHAAITAFRATLAADATEPSALSAIRSEAAGLA